MIKQFPVVFIPAILLFSCREETNSHQISALIPVELDDNSILKQNSTEAFIRFSKSLPLLRAWPDTKLKSNTECANQWYDSSFVNSNLETTLMMLEKIKNDLLISEHQLIRYCINRTSGDTRRIEHETLLLITLSSSNIKAGDPIEITAGIGTFSIAA